MTMAHELKSRLAAIRELLKIHRERQQAEAWLRAEPGTGWGPMAMYPILFLAAVGVVASSIPAYSAGDSRVAPRIAVAGGPSLDIDAGCLDAYVVDPDRAEQLRRRWRCPVNLNADGTIDHRRGRR
jgi:hypothetical protein